MKQFVDSWSKKYDDNKYPSDFYLYFLSKIKNSDSPKDLAHAIICLLHWKDGKVYRAKQSEILINGVYYSYNTAKPNTYNPNKHYNVFVSMDFFDWANIVREGSTFKPELIKSLRGEPFYLWSSFSIVIPAFLMHILSPIFYPLYDQHVERAKRAILADKLNKDSTTLNLNTYISYQSFFSSVVGQYALINSLDVHRNFDKAFWSFGKWIKGLNENLDKLEPTEDFASYKRNYVPDIAFKLKVIQLIEGGYTQQRAIKQAAEEEGVILKESYYRYPGSHIHRWKNQLELK